MNADVIIWGPLGNARYLKRTGGAPLKTWEWKDLEDKELEDSINWLISATDFGAEVEGYYGLKTIKEEFHIHIHSDCMHMPVGQTTKIGKNIAGMGTLFYYMIVSDEKVESEEQAIALVWESLNGGENDSEDHPNSEPG